MVLKADGSKYACHSCLKGHRVSACTHVDRELIFVPKKGRPVTQCQHCRQERKKRSAHVKCDCGEAEKPHHPKEKCIHLREAEERARAGSRDDQLLAADKDADHLAAVADEQGCCCHHGGKCTCSLIKKEPGQDGTAPHGPAVKPRLEKTGSDSSITVFSNGHHKPVHRNHAAHECGMPYKIPMPRSLTDHSVPTAARRSVDSLALDMTSSYQPAPYMTMPNDTSDSGRSTATPESGNHQVASSVRADPHVPDLNGLTPSQTNQSVTSSASDAFGFPTYESMSAATDGSFDPWSACPSADAAGMLDCDAFAACGMPDDFFAMGRPALTAGSSGTQSEVDEIPPMEDAYGFAMPSIQEDVSAVNSVADTDLSQWNRRSLPASFFGNIDFTAGRPSEQNEGIAMSSASKSRPQPIPSFAQFDDAWQSPDGISSSVPHRQMAAMSSSRRPPSYSVGQDNAPSDDLIRQLFPDFDEADTSMFGTGMSGSPVDMSIALGVPHDKMTLGMLDSTTSAPMDIGQMDTSSGFRSQAWGDGSISMPNDDYVVDAYDLGQEFATADLNVNWPQ